MTSGCRARSPSQGEDIDQAPSQVSVEGRSNGIEGQHIVGYLNTLLKKIASRNGKPVDVLTKDIHVLPDFHGNRSPLADPTMKGMICGLSLSTDDEQLAILYLATVQALAP
ncbi:FGGY carbohydrate kinase domain-containing protein-like [Halyomorpha halys]|uniref:FGGY carbohydrate kinase domain-containing protein-like n=1 Tax=Halyomorpha halys TaxID=286706 RepID=UPI0034D19E69